MKKNLVIFSFVFSFATAWIAHESGNQALALSGCCKVRATENDPWGKTDTDLESCKVKNEEDGDNVAKKTGNIWWDTAC